MVWHKEPGGLGAAGKCAIDTGGGIGYMSSGIGYMSPCHERRIPKVPGAHKRGPLNLAFPNFGTLDNLTRGI